MSLQYNVHDLIYFKQSKKRGMTVKQRRVYATIVLKCYSKEMFRYL